jgi:hypothetical protein
MYVKAGGKRHSDDDVNERILAVTKVQSPFPAFASSRSLNEVFAPKKSRLEPVGQRVSRWAGMISPRLNCGVSLEQVPLTVTLVRVVNARPRERSVSTHETCIRLLAL